jgi:hypothetical protein
MRRIRVHLDPASNSQHDIEAIANPEKKVSKTHWNEVSVAQKIYREEKRHYQVSHSDR